MRYQNNKSLKYYEHMIQLHEERKINLDDDQLENLADDILNFDYDIDWMTSLESKYKPGCEPENCPDDICERCPKLCQDECEFTKAIALADYIYRNLITNLPRGKELLCEYLEGVIYDAIQEENFQKMCEEDGYGVMENIG